MTTPPRHTNVFLGAARAALDLVADPAVAAAWDQPSALAEWDVAGLAGHLTRAIATLARYLDAPVDPDAVSELTDGTGYVLAVLDDEGLSIDSDLAKAIRARGDEEAGVGHTALLESARATLDGLEARLGAEDAERPIQVLDGIAITLDDYIATRVVELVIHTDDLAVSVGLPTVVPDDAVHLTAEIVLEITRQRRGELAVVRAVTRRERVADTPLAF